MEIDSLDNRQLTKKMYRMIFVKFMLLFTDVVGSAIFLLEITGIWDGLDKTLASSVNILTFVSLIITIIKKLKNKKDE
jgi:hypothetical protein